MTTQSSKQTLFRKISGGKLVAALVGTGVILAAGSAWAAHHRGHAISIEQAESKMSSAFDTADVNADGALDMAEFSTIPSLRRHGQKGMRGQHARKHKRQRMANMTPEEKQAFKAKRKARHEERAERREEMHGAVFAKLDTDGSGELSLEESAPKNHKIARKAVHQEHVFAILDANNDGSIIKEELLARIDRLRQADTDSDGMVSVEERKAMRRARRDAAVDTSS